jgi:hypothetical protein
MDNCNGNGFPYGAGDPSFWIAGDCPLHAKKIEKERREGFNMKNNEKMKERRS